MPQKGENMELEILVLPDPNPIGVQECDDEAGAPCITNCVQFAPGPWFWPWFFPPLQP